MADEIGDGRRAAPDSNGRGANLALYVERYRDSLLPGGSAAYVAESLGYAPLPFEAEVVEDGAIVERWPAC